MKMASEHCMPTKRSNRFVTHYKRPAQGPASLWWLHPFWVMAAPVMVLSLIALLLPEAAYRDNWRTAKAFDSTSFVMCFAAAVLFCGGGLVATWINAGFAARRPLPPGPRESLRGARTLKILFDCAFAVTVIAYAIWLVAILRHGGIGMFANVLLGGAEAPDILKRSAEESTIAGITTFTQFGIGTAMLGTYLGVTRGWGKVRARLLILLAFTGIRAVFMSERLSLIEIVLPSVVLFVRLIGNGRPGSALRRFLLVAPIVGIVGLCALFTFTEYFRSWSTFYAGRNDQSLFSFSLLRLLGYYITALNNGAVYWQEHGAIYFPYYTLGFIWKFPLIGEALQMALGGTSSPSDVQTALLKADANPEFNNSSGIFLIPMDMGVPGAIAYFAIYGCIAGLLYHSYRRGSIAGLLLYSFMVTGLTDQARILYLHSGRAFPTWMLLLFVILVLRSKQRHNPSTNAPQMQAASSSAMTGPSG